MLPRLKYSEDSSGMYFLAAMSTAIASSLSPSSKNKDDQGLRTLSIKEQTTRKNNREQNLFKHTRATRIKKLLAVSYLSKGACPSANEVHNWTMLIWNVLSKPKPNMVAQATVLRFPFSYVFSGASFPVRKDLPPASFPWSLLFLGKKRDPGNEVGLSPPQRHRSRQNYRLSVTCQIFKQVLQIFASDSYKLPDQENRWWRWVFPFNRCKYFLALAFPAFCAGETFPRLSLITCFLALSVPNMFCSTLQLITYLRFDSTTVSVSVTASFVKALRKILLKRVPDFSRSSAWFIHAPTWSFFKLTAALNAAMASLRLRWSMYWKESR